MRGSLLKKSILTGAGIGAAAAFVLQAAMTVTAYVSVTGVPGFFELVFQLALLCGFAAAGGVAGAIMGLVGGLVIGALFSK